MRTIPMKTRKIHTRWTDQSQGVLAQSLAKRAREQKWDNRRYGFSIFLFAFALTGLLMGSFGGVTQNASAQSRSDSWRNWFSNYWNFQNTDRQTTQTTDTDRTETNQPEETVLEPTQTPATEETTTPSVTQPAQATTNETVAPVLPSIVAPSANAAEPVVPDTSEEIVATTSAQAAVESTPVTYTSQQISTETRDRLLAVAAIAVTSAVVIYILSLFGTSSATVSSTSPVRLRVPSREV